MSTNLSSSTYGQVQAAFDPRILQFALKPEARRDRACLHAELLQRVREGEGKIDVRHRVGVVAAVEQIRRAVRLPAGDGDARRAVKRLAARVARVPVGRLSQAHDQL